MPINALAITSDKFQVFTFPSRLKCYLANENQSEIFTRPESVKRKSGQHQGI